MTEENNPPANWFGIKEMSGARQFALLVGLICAGLLVASICTALFLVVSTGMNINELAAGAQMQRNTSIWILVIQDVFLFALPALLFAKLVKNRKDYFYFKSSSPAILWLLVLIIAFAAMPVSDLFGLLNKWIPISSTLAAKFTSAEAAYNAQAISILDLGSIGGLIQSIVVIALLPAVVEELVFRGALQQVMLKWTKTAFPAILITSIIFSGIHFSYYGFLPRVVLGMVLGYIYYYGKDIKLNMLAHFVNNASVVVALYISNQRHALSIKDLESSGAPVYLQIIGLVVLITALAYFAMRAKKINFPPSIK